MPTSQSNVLSVAGATPEDREAAARAAAAALAAGKIIVLPTETVYGVAACPASAEGIAALTGATSLGGLPPVRPAAWHAPSAEVALEVLRPASGVHRRLMSRLMPGPVTFLLVLPLEELEAARGRLSGLPGTLHDGREFAVRVPEHPLGRAVIEAAWKANTPVVAQGVAAAGWGTGHHLEPADLKAIAANRAVGAVVDDGPTRFGGPSTTVRLKPDGGYEIVVSGAVPERIVRRQLERTVLFVCTGNTCRSPMAEAIAVHMAKPSRQATGPKISTTFRSAGASAGRAEPVTNEAITALEQLGIDPALLMRHRARDLSRQMIADAEIIYAMTAAHARAILNIDPTAAAKVQLLDPSGRDIPDPIGHPLEVYTRTAERLAETIRQRLAELEVPQRPLS